MDPLIELLFLRTWCPLCCVHFGVWFHYRAKMFLTNAPDFPNGSTIKEKSYVIVFYCLKLLLTDQIVNNWVLYVLICVFWSFHLLLQAFLFFFLIVLIILHQKTIALRAKDGLLHVEVKCRFPIERQILPFRRLNRLVLTESQLVKFRTLEKIQSKNSLWI